MPGDRPHAPWSIDRDVLRSMRHGRAHAALQNDDVETALVEAEELLDEHADDAVALRLVGEAALAMGDAGMAALAWGRLFEADPQDAVAAGALAVARFETVEIALAREAAERSLALDPEHAEVWYVLGLAAERLGDADAARDAFARAAVFDPETFPAPRILSDEEWTAILASARRKLKGPLRAFYARVPVRWEDFPATEELRTTDPPLSPFVAALYEGTPPAGGDPWTELPSAVRLFRHNLDRPPAKRPELVARVARALADEARAWLGGDEEEGEPGEEGA